MGLKRILKKIIVFFYRIASTVIPVRKNTMVFCSNLGKSYAGNPRAIYQCLQKKESFKEKRCIWFFTQEYLAKKDRELPVGCKIVRYGHPLYYFYLAAAGCLIYDSRQESYFRKRKKAVYLQTWHGTPLKKLALDMDEFHMAGEADAEAYREAFKAESGKWDYLIVQNGFSAETFRRCFAYDGRIIETGYPRNDILADYKKNPSVYRESLLKLRQKLGIGSGKRILLYAPTWRDDCFLGDGWYAFDKGLDFELMERELADEYVLLVKTHYLVKTAPGDIPESCIRSGFVKLCGNEIDIAMLYMLSDMLITDYSSVMFDYSLLEQPMLFFVYDLERYRDKLRGFYFDFEQEAPGPLIEDTQSLATAVRAQECGALHERYESFREKYNSYDKGNASEQVLGYLERH